MSAPKNRAEIIRLPVGIPGVGRKGDRIVHDPGHPNPHFRLSRVGPLDPDLLPAIKEVIRQAENVALGAPPVARPAVGSNR